jgi:hypothetical protein
MNKNYIVLDHCGSEEKVELPDCESVSIQQVIDAVNEQSSWTAVGIEDDASADDSWVIFCGVKLIPPSPIENVGISEIEFEVE